MYKTIYDFPALQTSYLDNYNQHPSTSTQVRYTDLALKLRNYL